MDQTLTDSASTQELTLPIVRDRVNNLLDAFYVAQLARSEALHPSYSRLWAVMLQNHRAGGKRLRPYLMLLTYSSLSGQDYEAVLPVAAALELLHASLLTHDDIIDRDYIRHGEPNIAGQYKTIYKAAISDGEKLEHYADSAALLAGDLLLAGAYRLIATCSLPSAQRGKLLEILDEALFVVAGGELLDTEATFMQTDRQNSLRIAELKTAHYSFVTPFQMGATLANAKPAVVRTLTDIGEAIGIAYQLADDLLGMYGDEAHTGKSVSSDIEEGKHTYLIELGFQLADPAGLKLLEATLGNPVATAQDIAATKQLLIDCGAKAATEKRMQWHYSRAEQLLANGSLNARLSNSLQQLLTELVRREA